MSLSPIPALPFALTPICLTFNVEKHPTDPAGPSRPQLRLKLTPRLLIPSPPLPFKLGSKRSKIEEMVDVVVPVGGKVGMKVRVPEDGMDAVFSGRKDYDEDDVEDLIRRRIKSTLLENGDQLGILHVDGGGVSSARSASPSTSSTIPNSHASDALRLSLTAARPLDSPLNGNLIPVGRLIAYLTDLDLSFQWVNPKPATGVPQHEDPSEQEQEKMGEHQVVADLVSSNTHGETSPSIPSDECSHHNTRDCDRTATKILPDWALAQVDQALQKVMRQYMIKRFPLVFDASLLKYSSSLALHRSIPDSLMRFVNYSRGNHIWVTDQEPWKALKSLSRTQELELRERLIQALSLPSTAKRNPPAMTELSPNLGIPSQSKGRKRKKHVVEEDHEDPVDRYMNELNDKIGAEDMSPSQQRLSLQAQSQAASSKAIVLADRKRKRVKSVVDHALGQMGRNKWEEVRGGRGRLSWGRIKFIIPQVEASFPTSLIHSEAGCDLSRQDDTSTTENHQPINFPVPKTAISSDSGVSGPQSSKAPRCNTEPTRDPPSSPTEAIQAPSVPQSDNDMLESDNDRVESDNDMIDSDDDILTSDAGSVLSDAGADADIYRPMVKDTDSDCLISDDDLLLDDDYDGYLSNTQQSLPATCGLWNSQGTSSRTSTMSEPGFGPSSSLGTTTSFSSRPSTATSSSSSVSVGAYPQLGVTKAQSAHSDSHFRQIYSTSSAVDVGVLLVDLS